MKQYTFFLSRYAASLMCILHMGSLDLIFQMVFNKRTFSFEVINNLIVVPIKINGQNSTSF